MNDDKKINKKMIFDEDFLKICQFSVSILPCYGISSLDQSESHPTA